jgi:hypothetical protein
MIIGDEIKKKISATLDGVILTIDDFNVNMQYQNALVKALNRLVTQGMLGRLSKGKYYKPRKTIFGTLKPVPEEITKDLLEKNGKIIGDSPLLTNFHEVWKELQSLYMHELPDLAYQEIPSAEEIGKSLLTILSTKIIICYDIKRNNLCIGEP